MKRFAILGPFISIIIMSFSTEVMADGAIAFFNLAGEQALVRLFGPTNQTLDVPKGEKRKINVTPGEYYFIVRWGNKSYTYARSDKFVVPETTKRVEGILITFKGTVRNDFVLIYDGKICPICDGKGFIQKPNRQICPKCKGIGVIK